MAKSAIARMRPDVQCRKLVPETALREGKEAKNRFFIALQRSFAAITKVTHTRNF